MIAKLAILFLLAAPWAWSWGQEGHRITAQIAERHLSSKALAAVRQILGPNRSLADIANLADEVRNQHPETAPWHYVDIPLTATSLDRAKYCPNDQCVIGAIERFQRELAAPGLSPERRYEALYYFVHFVGDLHQPLHCGDQGDRGGNDVQVKFQGELMNLHQVWDSGIIKSMQLDGEKLRRLGKISRRRRRAWARGTPEQWAMESHDLARDVAYRFPEPVKDSVMLDQNYERRAASVVRTQLAKAGYRLAYALNQIYR